MSKTSAYVALNNELTKRRRKQGTGDSGGGGQPNIELPKNNRDIKITARSVKTNGTPRRSTGRFSTKINTVIISNWVRNDKKAVGRLQGALRYNQERERSRDEDERTFYTAKDKNLDRADIRKEVRNNFGKDIAFHTIILSPGDNSIDIKDFTRETMDEWQQHLGYHLYYYAIEHRNTDHYHAHLIIPAASIDKETDIKFTRQDLENLREIANDHLAREHMIDRAFDRAVGREFGFDRQEQLDREIQNEFHMRNKDYRDEQEAVGLSTYSDYVKDWKELGVGKVYDLGETNWESSKQMMDDLFSESERGSSEQDWDETSGMDFYRDEDSDENTSKERNKDTNIIHNTITSDRNDEIERDDDNEDRRHR